MENKEIDGPPDNLEEKMNQMIKQMGVRRSDSLKGCQECLGIFILFIAFLVVIGIIVSNLSVLLEKQIQLGYEITSVTNRYGQTKTVVHVRNNKTCTTEKSSIGIVG